MCLLVAGVVLVSALRLLGCHARNGWRVAYFGGIVSSGFVLVCCRFKCDGVGVKQCCSGRACFAGHQSRVFVRGSDPRVCEGGSWLSTCLLMPRGVRNHNGFDLFIEKLLLEVAVLRFLVSHASFGTAVCFEHTCQRFQNQR